MILLIMFIMISLVGAGIVDQLEVRRGKRPATLNSLSVMGQWPYNILLVIGVVVFILSNGKSYEKIVGIAIVISTTAFYGFTIHRIFRH